MNEETAQPVQPEQTPTPQPVELPENISAERQKEIQTQKARYKTLGLIIKLALGALVLIVVGAIATKIITNFFKKEYDTEPQQVEQQPVARPDDSWILYENQDLKLTLKYPNDALATSNGVDKIIKGDRDALVEGYVFKITPLVINNKTLEEIAETKRQSFKQTCLPTVSISSAVGAVIDGKPAVSFEVNNCEPNYKITYYQHEGVVYEVAQIYNGDIGIKQKYKSETDEIFNTLQIIQTIFSDEELSDSYMYNNGQYHVSFKYLKNLDTTCCNAPIPPGTLHLTFLNAFITPSKGFGVYGFLNQNKLSLDDFVQQQKSLLTDDFRVVRGEDPNGVEEALPNANGYSVMKLSGYSWQNNDLIYIMSPFTSRIVVISVSDPSSADLAKALANTLDSLTFSN